MTDKWTKETNKGKKALLSQGNRTMPQLFFGLKFANNIDYKFSQASKARLQSSKHKPTDAKQHLTQNGHSKSFKVIQGHVFWSQWKGSKPLRDYK